MTALTIELDTRALEAWTGQTTKKINSALRSSVDRSARYARSKAIVVLAADSGVPAARFRNATPLVKGSTAADLTATWTVSKSPNFIRGPGGAVLAPVRGQGVEASTFTVTGGGSSALSLPKAFALPINGGRAVFVRTGKGRNAIRAIYAEMPNTAMSQQGSAVRKAWQEAAADSVSLLVVAAVQAALDGANEAPTVGKLAGKTS